MVEACIDLETCIFQDNHLVASLSDTVESAKKPPPKPPRAHTPELSGGGIRAHTPELSGGGDDAHIQSRATPPPLPPRPKSISPAPEHMIGGQPQPQEPFTMVNYASGASGMNENGSGYPSMPQYVNPQMPQVMADTGMSQGNYNITQYSENRSSPGLYPHLSLESEFKGPCTKGLLLIVGNYGANVSSFLKPFGLAVGRNGEYVASDRAGNRILVFSNKGELKSCFTLDCTVNGIAITKDNDLLVAVSKSGSAIMRQYSLQGRFMHKFGDYYRYDVSSGITVTPNNHVAITNIQADNVLVFTDQRKMSVKFGWKGAGDKHFMTPRFIASTTKNYVVVSDTGNHCIKVLDLQGNFKRAFGGKGNLHGKLDTPLGVATDHENNIIVADSNNHRVEVYTVKGIFYTTLVQDTNLIGPDVKPINVAVTPRNNIAVLLSGTGFAEVRIYCWKPDVVGTGVSSEI